MPNFTSGLAVGKADIVTSSSLRGWPGLASMLLSRLAYTGYWKIPRRPKKRKCGCRRSLRRESLIHPGRSCTGLPIQPFVIGIVSNVSVSLCVDAKAALEPVVLVLFPSKISKEVPRYLVSGTPLQAVTCTFALPIRSGPEYRYIFAL